MILTIILALVGSVVFNYLAVPLGAMFGSLLIILMAGKLGTSLKLPKATLTLVQLILGTAVGAVVPVQMLISSFPMSLLFGLVLCMFFQVTVSYLWLNKKEGWSRYESLLGSVPGAMAAVLVVNENYSNPSNKVVFTHTVRLVFLVLASALFVSTDNPPVPGDVLSIDSALIVIPLVFAYLFGLLLEKIGTPAPYMVTGMLVTMIVNTSYLPERLNVPTELVFIATSALGALIGARLKDITVRQILSYARAGVIATILSLTVTVIFAYSFSLLIDREFIVLLMSWVPGSVESMTVAAIYLGLEPASIMLSHIVRMIILHSIPVCFNAYQRIYKAVGRS